MQYATPEAFKQGLEARVRAAAKAAGTQLARFRQVLIFDRFLARIFAELGDRVIVKGGVVLEFRLARARTTRDVDLRLVGPAGDLLGRLQAAGRRDLGDYLSFTVEVDREHPLIDGDGVVYEGRRFRAAGQLAGKPYGAPFGVDVALGDVLTSAPDVVDSGQFLEFIGVPPTPLRLYPRDAHIAEKLHADAWNWA